MPIFTTCRVCGGQIQYGNPGAHVEKCSCHQKAVDKALEALVKRTACNFGEYLLEVYEQENLSVSEQYDKFTNKK